MPSHCTFHSLSPFLSPSIFSLVLYSSKIICDCFSNPLSFLLLLQKCNEVQQMHTYKTLGAYNYGNKQTARCRHKVESKTEDEKNTLLSLSVNLIGRIAIIKTFEYHHENYIDVWAFASAMKKIFLKCRITLFNN